MGVCVGVRAVGVSECECASGEGGVTLSIDGLPARACVGGKGGGSFLASGSLLFGDEQLHLWGAGGIVLGAKTASLWGEQTKRV